MSKRREFYKLYRDVHKMSRTNAALAAGYPDSIAFRKSTPVRPINFNDAFEQKCMTTSKKVDFLLEAMQAEKVISVEVVGEFTSQGKKVYRNVTVPDWPSRLKAGDMAFKACGHYDKENTSSSDGASAMKNLAQLLQAATDRVSSGMSRVYIRHEPEAIDVGATTCP